MRVTLMWPRIWKYLYKFKKPCFKYKQWLHVLIAFCVSNLLKWIKYESKITNIQLNMHGIKLRENKWG